MRKDVFKHLRKTRLVKSTALNPKDPIFKKLRKRSALRLRPDLIQTFFDYERLERLSTIKRRKSKKKYLKHWKSLGLSLKTFRKNFRKAVEEHWEKEFEKLKFNEIRHVIFFKKNLRRTGYFMDKKVLKFNIKRRKRKLRKYKKFSSVFNIRYNNKTAPAGEKSEAPYRGSTILVNKPFKSNKVSSVLNKVGPRGPAKAAYNAKDKISYARRENKKGA